MKVGVLEQQNKRGNPETAQEILRFLTESGYECVRFSSHKEIDGVDVVIVLGGDGAILHTAVFAAQKGIKIIGINYGTLGFLTEYEKTERELVKELLSALEQDLCRIVKRSLLQVTVGENTYYALNEVSIHRDNSLNSAEFTKILDVNVSTKEGEEIISGDGLLICTPTGSTAYSLSAGGAILTPEVPVFMLTPICAFSMRARPIVFSDLEEFTLKIKKGRAIVLVDGKAVAALSKNEEIKVKKSPFTADFPVKEGASFLERVKNKLYN